MTTLLFILAALFVIAGWGSAEMNFRTERKKAQKLQRTMLLMKQKTEKLDSLLEHNKMQIDELNNAYEYAKQRADKQGIFEAENKNLKSLNADYQDLVKWIEKKTRSREYANNALARVIKTHIEHVFPSEQTKEEQAVKQSKETFQRIKKSM